MGHSCRTWAQKTVILLSSGVPEGDHCISLELLICIGFLAGGSHSLKALATPLQVCLGGKNRVMRESIMRAVQGCPYFPFRIVESHMDPACHNIGGVSPHNIVNKCSTEGVLINHVQEPES